MKTHHLKSWPEFFEPMLTGAKPFELRKNDRDFQTGDILLLCEFDPNTDRYTGREVKKRVTYVLRGIGSVGTIAPYKGLSMGYAILGITDEAAEMG
jgi:hypothetical protein